MKCTMLSSDQSIASCSLLCLLHVRLVGTSHQKVKHQEYQKQSYLLQLAEGIAGAAMASAVHALLVCWIHVRLESSEHKYQEHSHCLYLLQLAEGIEGAAMASAMHALLALC